jgi:hypothetical protein
MDSKSGNNEHISQQLHIKIALKDLYWFTLMIVGAIIIYIIYQNISYSKVIASKVKVKEEILCVESFGSERDINKTFMKTSSSIASISAARVLSVTTAPGCTYKIVINNPVSKKTETIYKLPIADTYIVGRMLSSEMLFNRPAILDEKSETIEKPKPPKASSSNSDIARTETNNLKQQEPIDDSQSGLNNNPHLSFFTSSATVADSQERGMRMLDYAMDLPGTQVGKGPQKMAVFYDPFCTYCHSLYAKLKSNTNFTQRWIPISLGLHERGASLGGLIARTSKDNNTGGKNLLDKIMINNILPTKSTQTTYDEYTSMVNTQFILPILIQAKAGSPFIFVETAQGGVELFPGVPDMLTVKKWHGG